MSERRVRMRIASSHPALPGHFPGRPLVPGVVLLDHVIETIRSDGAQGEGARARGFPSVKFVRAIGPDVDFEIVWEPAPAGAVQRFRCEDEQGLIVQGSLDLVSRA